MKEVGWLTVLTYVVVLSAQYASAGECDNLKTVTECYENLVHYENLGFPLYGGTEKELDETCQVMKFSFQYIYYWMPLCHDSPECGKECEEIKADVGVFLLNTGLKELQDDLCTATSPIRHTYLENFKCLEKNANQYASCHNDSQMSQEYMFSMKGKDNIINARCCYMYWYHDCFTNVTRDTCNENATLFVSLSLTKLIGQIAHQLCGDNHVVCDRPPLPPGVNEITDEKPDRTSNDIDNTVEGNGSAKVVFGSVMHLLALVCAVVGVRRILS